MAMCLHSLVVRAVKNNFFFSETEYFWLSFLGFLFFLDDACTDQCALIPNVLLCYSYDTMMMHFAVPSAV